MTSGEQLITFKRTELESLIGAGPLAFQAYVLLRWWMDYRTGITGRQRPVSLAMLAAYCETHTPRGAGLQIEKPTEKSIRCAIDRLQRIGLLRRLAGTRLAFSLPMAAIASARPIQTGHGAGRHSSTEQGGSEAKRRATYRPIQGMQFAAIRQPNRAHIKNHVCERVPDWLVDKLTAAGILPDSAASAIDHLAELANSPERLDDAIERARRLRQRAGSTQALNAGLLRSILQGAGNHPGIWMNALPATRQLTNRQPQIDPQAPPRPGESWDAYRLRLHRSAPNGEGADQQGRRSQLEGKIHDQR
ncbi:hypothetical protein GCM10007933_21950 [Zoogloea oryzae]|uniref:Helix-turn-helix domain-containing protein n=1 Tax=Zoogloea oryzae TaxID=310767 RepID=A0ABQ6FAW6_9RHOO|nr:hypothetical protein [Zoogloea oryzae]GLT22735.1 hypothetical protein GCM10007933_21950 [Zoogloea oryzae]